MSDIPFRWVFFDAVGTLIKPVPSVASVYQTVAANHGVQLSKKLIQERFKVALFRDEDESTSEELEYEFWRTTVHEVIGPTEVDEACFRELWDHFAQPNSWERADGVETLIPILIDAGIEIAVLSNFDRRLHGIMDADPFLSRISRRLISSEIGWRKPHAKFYGSLLEWTGDCPPENWLMVGDDEYNDIIPACTMGMATYQVSDKSRENQGPISELLNWIHRQGGQAGR